MKIKKYFITFAIIFLMNINIIKTEENDAIPLQGRDYPLIECGKKNPKKGTDCNKYGTDSGMLCCFVEFKDEEKKFCTLLYQKTAEDKFHIDGYKDFGQQKWDCGNKSFYININIILFLILFFLFL